MDEPQTRKHRAKKFVSLMVKSLPVGDIGKISPGTKRTLQEMIDEDLMNYEERELNKKIFGMDEVKVTIESSCRSGIPTSLQYEFKPEIPLELVMSTFSFAPFKKNVRIQSEFVFFEASVSAYFCITNPEPNILRFVRMANRLSKFRIDKCDCSLPLSNDTPKKFMMACFWRFMETEGSIYSMPNFETRKSQNATIEEAFIEAIFDKNYHITLEELKAAKPSLNI